MRIPYKTKLLLALSICTIVFIAGCVDTSVQSIPNSIDYSSQIKVVNLVSGAGTAALILNGQSLGSAGFGAEVPGSQVAFLTIPAGNKVLITSFASAATDTSRFAAATDSKFRVFLVGTDSSNELVLQTQRYIWQTPGSANEGALFPVDTGQVAFFNGSPDAILNSVTVYGADTTTIEFDSPLAMGDGGSYIKIKAGAYTFDVLYNDTEHVTFNYTLNSKGRYTAAIYDVVASIKNAVFVDD